MRKRPSLRGFLLAMLGTMLVAVSVAFALPHNSYLRYQSFEGTIFENLTWVYDRLNHDPTPIDVLVLGSSRLAHGLNAAELEVALSDRGLDLHVANVSMPATGFDERISVLREALRTHDIKLVLWGLQEAFPRDGHQAFADLGTEDEIVASPWLINRNLPDNVAQLPYRQIRLAVASILPEAFGLNDEFDPASYGGATMDLSDRRDPEWSRADEINRVTSGSHAQALADESAQRRHQITWPILPEKLAGLEFGVSRHYIDELMSLSEDHGFQVVFVFLPFYEGYEAPLEREYLKQRAPLWSANFLKNDPANYIDAAHASVLGIEKLAPWTADHIESLLQQKETR